MERKWRSIRTSPVGERMKRDWIIANKFALIVSSSVVCCLLFVVCCLFLLFVVCWLLVVVLVVLAVGFTKNTQKAPKR